MYLSKTSKRVWTAFTKILFYFFFRNWTDLHFVFKSDEVFLQKKAIKLYELFQVL